MIVQSQIPFCKDATSPVTPVEPYYNAKAEVIAIEISGTFTSGSFVFEGKTNMFSTAWTPLAAINLSDYTIVQNGVATAAGIYEVGIEGIQQFRVRVAEVSGGEVTVFGRVITTGV